MPVERLLECFGVIKDKWYSIFFVSTGVEEPSGRKGGSIVDSESIGNLSTDEQMEFLQNSGVMVSSVAYKEGSPGFDRDDFCSRYPHWDICPSPPLFTLGDEDERIGTDLATHPWLQSGGQ